MDNQEFDTDQIGFDSRHCAVVPIAFLDRLLTCYYGYGPRSGEGPVAPPVTEFTPSGPVAPPVGPGRDSVEIDALRKMVNESTLPKGFVPKGVAKRKAENQKESKPPTPPIETENADRQRDTTTEE